MDLSLSNSQEVNDVNIKQFIESTIKYLQATKKFAEEKKVMLNNNDNQEEQITEDMIAVPQNSRSESQTETDRTSQLKKGANKTLFTPNTNCQILNNINYAVNLSNKNLESFQQLQNVNLSLVHSLDLSQNMFSQLNFDMNQLKNLKILKLDNNIIKDLPIDLFQCLRLETFSVQNNLIRQIPIEIMLWKNCAQSINISKNHIETFPAEIMELNELSQLYLGSNDFYLITDKFLKLKKLKEFSLDWFAYCNPPRSQILKGAECEQFKQNLGHYFITNQTVEITINSFLEYFSTIVNLNHHDPLGRTYMHNAVLNEDISILRFLIQNNFQLSRKCDQDGHTPLSLAIKEEHYFCAKLMIFNHLDVNYGGGIYGSNLIIAVYKLQFYLVRDLIKNGANINQIDGDGNNALHVVFTIFSKSQIEAKKIADLILQQGLDPNIYNSNMQTPLHIAAKKGYLSAIKFAYEYNLEQDYQRGRYKKFKFEMPGPDGQNILLISALNNNIEIVQFLLKNCKEVLKQSVEQQKTINMSQRSIILQKIFKNAEKKCIQESIDNIFKIRNRNKQLLQSINNNTDYEVGEENEDLEDGLISINEVDEKNKIHLKQQNNIQSNQINNKLFTATHKGNSIMPMNPSIFQLKHRDSMKLYKHLDQDRENSMEDFETEEIEENPSFLLHSKQRPYYSQLLMTEQNLQESSINLQFSNNRYAELNDLSIIQDNVINKQNYTNKSKCSELSKNFYQKKFRLLIRECNIIKKTKNRLMFQDLSLNRRLGYIQTLKQLHLKLEIVISQYSGKTVFELTNKGCANLIECVDLKDEEMISLLHKYKQIYDAAKESFQKISKEENIFDKINLQYALCSAFSDSKFQNNINILNIFTNFQELAKRGIKEDLAIQFVTESGYDCLFSTENELDRDCIQIEWTKYGQEKKLINPLVK